MPMDPGTGAVRPQHRKIQNSVTMDRATVTGSPAGQRRGHRGSDGWGDADMSPARLGSKRLDLKIGTVRTAWTSPEVN